MRPVLVIIEQVGRHQPFVGPCFSQLLYNPKCIGISRHIEMQDLPPVVADDEKAVLMLRAA
jgi:hypothetical protein